MHVSARIAQNIHMSIYMSMHVPIQWSMHMCMDMPMQRARRFDNKRRLETAILSLLSLRWGEGVAG